MVNARVVRGMKDAFTLGQELKQKEKEASEQRIQNALPGNWVGSTNRYDRTLIASLLYDVYYDGKTYDELPTAEEILDDFCSEVFHCSFTEMLKAYDKFLG